MHPLHQAIESMDYDSVKCLLEAGADPNVPDAEFGGARPLHLSIDIECEESCRRYDKGEFGAVPSASISRLLIEFGANPYLCDPAGQSPIDWATHRNHGAALQLFVNVVK
ncbi:ankyrin repeat domain-containing protein [Undibacterium sp. Ji50W]|uniref:ankyrin repeat domain-containing protein n=1 Tax=Undibacterium sp. Ji50W TaxID=3413041 RepID=UPI003BF0104E